MIKADNLLATLTAALEAKHRVKQNPDRLHVVLTEGAAHGSARSLEAASFSYTYTVAIGLLDFTGHPDEVMVPILLWLQRWQPEQLLNHGDVESGLSFEAVPLDDDKVDMMVRVRLTETVSFTPRQDGGYDVVHLEDPLPEWLDEQGEPLHAVYLDGEKIAHCTAHPGLGN